MTRLERLYENYEDALFSLLMEDVAEAEGRAALEENERLKNDPSAALSEGLQRKMMGAIRRGFAMRDLRTAGRISVKVIGKVAILVTAFVLSFSIAFAASAEVREAAAEWIISTYDDHLEFVIKDDDALNNDEVQGSSRRNVIGNVEVDIGWLPDDMKLFVSSRGENYIILDYRDREEIKQFIVYIKEAMEGGRFSIDSEDCQLSFMNIQGKSALVSTKKQSNTIFMPMDEIGAVAIYNSEGMSPETVKKITDTLTITIKE
ncbi:MAG: DUF4367 domain-containing protein [Oscillospiraceae bacterium]|nr:DUF4367 domain-containing protein [Oscillospiraceae bacterium]